MARIPLKTTSLMQIPDYIVNAVYTHYRRIAENSTCPPSDHRTRDALGLSRKDLQRLEKYIRNAEQRKNSD